MKSQSWVKPVFEFTPITLASDVFLIEALPEPLVLIQPPCGSQPHPPVYNLLPHHRSWTSPPPPHHHGSTFRPEKSHIPDWLVDRPTNEQDKDGLCFSQKTEKLLRLVLHVKLINRETRFAIYMPFEVVKVFKA